MESSSTKCKKCGSKAKSAIERAKKEPLIRKEEGISAKDEIRKQLNPAPKKTVDEALKQRREQWRERVVPMSHPVPKREEAPEETKTEPRIEPAMTSEPVFVEEFSTKKKSKAPLVLLLLVIAAGATIFFLWKNRAFTKNPSEPTEISSTEATKTSTETPSEKDTEPATPDESGNEEGEGVKIDESKVYDPSKTDEVKSEDGTQAPSTTETGAMPNESKSDPTDERKAENPGETRESSTGEPKKDATEQPTKETKKEEPNPEPLPPVGEGTYLLPDSATRRLTEADLTGLTKEQLRLARNEIYARRGRKFSDKSLKEYFSAQEWYRGRISGRDFNEKKMLTLVEQANVEVIKSYEKKMGYQSE